MNRFAQLAAACHANGLSEEGAVRAITQEADMQGEPIEPYEQQDLVDWVRENL